MSSTVYPHIAITGAPRAVLRLRPDADAWLSAARLALNDAPPAIRALITGRMRVELSPVEADAAIEWARRLPGWSVDAKPALTTYALGAPYARGEAGATATAEPASVTSR